MVAMIHPDDFSPSMYDKDTIKKFSLIRVTTNPSLYYPLKDLKMETKQVIREFFIQELNDNGFHEGIHDDQSLIDEGIMDSLCMLIMISLFGEKYNIFPNEDELDPDNFYSINAICNFVDKKINEVRSNEKQCY
jgi:acyl carrier protein